MFVAQLVALIDRLAPVHLAEDWDNVGLIVGRHNRTVRRVLVALELRGDVLQEARERGCDAIVVHHPPIFPAVPALTDAAPAQELVLTAAEERIAVVAAHTNLDSAAGGLNDQMAGMLGLRDVRPLAPAAGDPAAGLGRVGTVPPAPLEALVRRVAAEIPGAVSYSGDPGVQVARVACCTGSGASMIGDARAADAEVFVTSDLKYHDHDRAEGMPLIAVPHAQVERLAMRRWFRGFARQLHADGVESAFADTDTDPWQSVGR
ncbi:MAG: Nif3-like dinuclear metal center hexameric protein [Thermoleophilia bacterium]